MKRFKSEQTIGQLEKRKGGYFYLKVEADIVNQFKHKRQTRLICTLDKRITFQCGLNHLGDGNFFIILSGKNLLALDKTAGDKIIFELKEDPNPLGVEMPEVLKVLFEQDETIKNLFNALTQGKQRNVIHQVRKIKDIDKQVQKCIRLVQEQSKPLSRRRQ